MADSGESRDSADIGVVPEQSASDVNQASASGDVQEQHRGRKRARNPEIWKETICKKKRNEGKEYKSRSSGKVIEARKIGPECRDGCFDRVTRPIVEALFKEYWDLGNYDSQTSYLQKLILPVPVKRRRTLFPEESRRSTSVAYVLKYQESEFKVCKRGFMSIFGIGEKRCRVAMLKVTLGKTTVPDQRGRQATATKFEGPKAELVRDHINMLPTMTSHYSRAKSKLRKYLDSNLTVRKLYDLYVDHMQTEHPDVETVSFNYYSNVFRLEFNIGFAPPRLIPAAPVMLLKQASGILSSKGQVVRRLRRP